MKLKNIEIRKIHSHPDNPRKDLGDINELAESIKTNGVMQNLTVVEREDGDYTVIIGHRRLAASLQAGLDVVPCAVVKMDEKEQQSTMLVENMQRSDLTVYEQAQGFQMMLDLGSTEDEIAEKTGFSKQTVKHRINLAKLDPDILKEKNADENFQMTLKDMYELEKIDDVEARNEILSDSKDSANLKVNINKYVEHQRIEQNMSLFYKKLNEFIPDLREDSNHPDFSYFMYVNIKNKVTEQEIEEFAEDIIKRIEAADAREVILEKARAGYYIYIKEEEKEQTPEEKEKDILVKQKKEIIDKLYNKGKNLKKEIYQFVQEIILDKHKISRNNVDENVFIYHLWKLIIQFGNSETTIAAMKKILGEIYVSYAVKNKEEPDIKEDLDDMSIINQMWLTIVRRIDFLAPYDSWDARYREHEAELILEVCDCISVYGYYLKEEDEKFLKDKSELKEQLEQIEEKIKELNE